MTRRIGFLSVLAAVSVACAGSQREVREPAPEPRGPEISGLVFPAIDSATLASLSALLERLQQDTTLLSALSPSEPRMYALFRELEAAQKRLDIAFSAPDSTGRSLYDLLEAMTARTDSLFRSLEPPNRQPPRP